MNFVVYLNGICPVPNEGRGTLPTKKRQESSTGFYHVVVRGINKERIYNQRREKGYFKKIIVKHLNKYHVEIYAFCIMSNHAHFIIRAEIQELSLFMARILAEYASYYNYKHQRNGHVFQNRFTSECIETESYFWNCIRYIHLNPVKANMVKTPLRYIYSSMNEYCSNIPVVIHEKALFVYKERFSSVSEFKDFHQHRRYEIFSDIPDEKQEQRMEIALLILKSIFEKNNLELLEQVLEQKELRKEYIKQLKLVLNISDKLIHNICLEVRRFIEHKM